MVPAGRATSSSWPHASTGLRRLDGHVSGIDLIGKDVVTRAKASRSLSFARHPAWALQRCVALVLDEYDAGRPK